MSTPSLRLSLAETIWEFGNVQYTDDEREFVLSLIQRIQIDCASRKTDIKLDSIPYIIFLDLIGYSTNWADFAVLEVMALDDYSAKRISYTAAAQMWTPTSDVVLMSTNRIQRDLTSSKPMIASVVLSSISPYVSFGLAQHIANDVIKLMTSSKDYVQVKAITAFYHLCLKYPDALKPGFPTLRNLLDDSRPAIALAALSVLLELSIANPQNFIQMIPRFFKMFELRGNVWITIKVIQILTVLATVEPRLTKKLVQPYSEIIDSSSAPELIYEVCRSIVQIQLNSVPLLQLTVNRLQSFVNSEDVDRKSVFLSVLMKLLRLSPKLAAQNREIITECLDNEDETQQIIALELLGSMTNSKNVDKIVSKMFSHYQTATTIRFRNQIITTIIELCSRDDYKLVNDFNWYISVLLDFINESGFTCYQVVADQLIDLAARVPSTRARLAKEMSVVFEKNYEYKDTWLLLLAAAHIIGAHSPSSVAFDKIIGKALFDCHERVQQAFLTAVLEFFLRCPQKPNHIIQKLAIFSTSPFPSVQLDAEAYSRFVQQLLKDPETCESLTKYVQEQIAAEDGADVPIEPPVGFNARNELFENLDESEDWNSVGSLAKAKGKSVPKRKKRRTSEGDGESQEASHLQELGHNEAFTVNLDSVEAEESRLSLEIVFGNHSGSTITTIAVEMMDSAACRAIDVVAFGEVIENDEKGIHTITIECTKPFSPQIVRFLFIPVSSGGDSLEGRLRVFPSYFLGSVKQDGFPVDKCEHIKDVPAKLKVGPPVYLKQLTKLLKAKVVPDKATKSVRFYAKTSYGEFVQVVFTCEGKSANVCVRSTLAELSDSLGNEIEMSLKSL